MAFDRAAAKSAGYSDDEIDAYLAEQAKSQRPAMSDFKQPDESPFRSAGRSFEQGALLGWADEAVGGIGAGIELARTGSLSDAARAYRDITDHEREAAAQYAADNPKTDFALRMGGGLASLAATWPGRALAGPGTSYASLGYGGARVGALAGLGESNKDSLGEAAWDTTKGAGVGAALGVAIPFLAQQAVNAGTAAGRWAGRQAETVGSRLGALSSGQEVTATVQNAAGPTLGQQQAAQHVGALSSAQPEVTGNAGRLVNRADELGIRLTPGTRYQNDTLRRLEASLSSNDLTSAPFDAMKRANAGKYTELMAEKMGLPPGTSEVTPSRLGMTIDDIKSGMENIAGQIGRTKVDDIARQELNSLMTEATNPITPNFKLAAQIRRLQNAHEFNAGMTGKQLMKLRSDFNELKSLAYTEGNKPLADGYQGLMDVMEGLAERSAGPDIAPRWAQLRNQWRWAKQFEKGQTFNEATGKVRIGSLQASLHKDSAYLRGRDINNGVGDPLLDAARISLLSKDIVGDSGTATRLGFLSRLRNPLETTMTLTSRPFVNAYVNSGPRTAPVLGSLISGPQGAARAAQVGVLSEENARKRKKQGRK